MHKEHTTNQILKTLPMTGPLYLYREAQWIQWLYRGSLLAIAANLLYLAIVSALAAPGLQALFTLFGAALALLASLALPKGENALHFACNAEGIYFPERKLFAQHPASWLLVPWRNVLDYRVQPMLDETSDRGIAMALVASEKDEKVYLMKHAIFGRPKTGRQATQKRVILVGYRTFLPRPDRALLEMRKLDTLQRGSDSEDEQVCLLMQDAQA